MLGAESRIISHLRHTDEKSILSALLGCHIVLCCLSLALVAPAHPDFHIFFDPARLPLAVATVALFAVLAWVFVSVPFSFGYFVGFYFYTMVLGYLWLINFTDFEYNHALAALSAAASAVGFLVPALFVSAPLRQIFSIPPGVFDRFLTLCLGAGAATIALVWSYDFKIVPLSEIYVYRETLKYPVALQYSIGIVSGGLLPFVFGCFVMLRAYKRAALTLALLLCIYPLTLSKLAFFTPAWLFAMAVLSHFLTTRSTAVVSLFVPMLGGVLLVSLLSHEAVFDIVNFRMVAVPSSAMDIYNDFFFGNDLTFFCQINPIKHLFGCPYDQQLAVVMAEKYKLGNFNASLFATEGIASVGPLFAPIPAIACGLVFALANRLSAGLPPRLVLISGAVMPQILLNVPLSTTMLTHGAGLLFLLWYLTPRTGFEPRSTAAPTGQN